MKNVFEVEVNSFTTVLELFSCPLLLKRTGHSFRIFIFQCNWTEESFQWQTL
jgi:hypothetical protein